MLKTMEASEVKALFRASEEIRKSLEAHEGYAKNRGLHDKVGLGFNLDSRFSFCKLPTMSIDSWHGTYGHSGCSTAFNVGDEKLFSKYLISYLNRNIKTVLAAVAEKMRDDAILNKDVVVNEIKTNLQKWESMGSISESDEVKQ